MKATKIWMVTFSALLVLALSLAAVPPAAALSAGEPVSVLKNGSFELDSNNDQVPNNWVPSHMVRTKDGRTRYNHMDGSYSFKFSGNGREKTLTQSILRPGLAGDMLSFGMWSKAYDVPVYGTYRIAVTLYNNTEKVAGRVYNFNNGTHDWQQGLIEFSAPADYTRIVVEILFTKEKGAAWFDGGWLTIIR